jgi:hypothetical protein
VSDLSTVETNTLVALEKVIEKGKGMVIEVANALRKIRDGKLYRGSHKTFKAYCEERFDFTPQYALQICKSAEVIEEIQKSETIVSLLPTNEAQARPLSRLPKEEQAPAWKEAVDRSKGKPTAKVVEQVVEERTAGECPKGGKHKFDDEACEKCCEPKPTKADKRTEFAFGANAKDGEEPKPPKNGSAVPAFNDKAIDDIVGRFVRSVDVHYDAMLDLYERRFAELGGNSKAFNDAKGALQGARNRTHDAANSAFKSFKAWKGT